MIADLKATYPGIHARPLAEFGYKPCQHGVWTGGEAALADGEPIFCSLACPDPDRYDGQVHHAFIAWLDRRGWFVENYDGQVFFIRSTAEEAEHLAADLAYSDLLDQEREAKIVLHRLQGQISEIRAQRLETYGHDTDAAIERDKAGQHRLDLAALRCQRAPAAPGNESPI
ncbi:hypothetical protein [Pseudorhodoferax sp.]|uniref:hypothetical protein n=1 Tax=Pseudorhodoferax sp. TaxID=1993553 RepID=UPI0039E67992